MLKMTEVIETHWTKKETTVTNSSVGTYTLQMLKK